MQKLLPWFLVAGLVIGSVALYSSNQKEMVELEKLRAETQRLRAGLDDTNKTQELPANDELVRLRKDHEDLLRLRNEVRQLRDEKQQLTKQLQAAQA